MIGSGCLQICLYCHCMLCRLLQLSDTTRSVHAGYMPYTCRALVYYCNQVDNRWYYVWWPPFFLSALSFLLPLIIALVRRSKPSERSSPRILLLAPTRELAMHIEKQAKQLMKGKCLNLYTCTYKCRCNSSIDTFVINELHVTYKAYIWKRLKTWLWPGKLSNLSCARDAISLL